MKEIQTSDPHAPYALPCYSELNLDLSTNLKYNALCPQTREVVDWNTVTAFFLSQQRGVSVCFHMETFKRMQNTYNRKRIYFSIDFKIILSFVSRERFLLLEWKDSSYWNIVCFRFANVYTCLVVCCSRYPVSHYDHVLWKNNLCFQQEHFLTCVGGMSKVHDETILFLCQAFNFMYRKLCFHVVYAQ